MTTQSLSDNKKPKLFYGYFIVVAGFFIMAIIWGVVQSFGVFLKPMSADFGWTRTEISGASALSMLVLGFLFMITGRLTDRFGPRIVVTMCGICLGLAYLLMSRLNNLWQLYLLYGVMAAIGPSGGFVPLASTVTRWFVTRRGLLTGIVASGHGLGGVFGPPLASWLILGYGWRTSNLVLGVICLVLLTAFAQLLKRGPSEIGQLPYGQSEVTAETLDSENGGYSTGQAMRTSQFWMLSIMNFCAGFAVNLVLVHIVPNATDLGIAPALAANILVMVGFLNFAGRIVVGGLGDKIGNKAGLVLSFVLFPIALFSFQFAIRLWTFYLLAAVVGLCWAGTTVLMSPSSAKAFGLKNHSSILGMITFALAAGGAVGPVVAGKVYDVYGNYNLSFVISAALSMVGLVAAIMLKPTREEKQVKVR